MIGDVDGVILFYRLLDRVYPSSVMLAIMEVRGSSISGCGVIVIWRREWDLCDQLALLRVLLVYQIRTRLFPWARSIKNFQQFSESIDTVY